MLNNGTILFTLCIVCYINHGINDISFESMMLSNLHPNNSQNLTQTAIIFLFHLPAIQTVTTVHYLRAGHTHTNQPRDQLLVGGWNKRNVIAVLYDCFPWSASGTEMRRRLDELIFCPKSTRVAPLTPNVEGGEVELQSIHRRRCGLILHRNPPGSLHWSPA